MQSCNLVSISCDTDRHESVWRVLVGCGLLNWIYPDHCTPVMLHFFDLSKLSKKFCFPEELAVVPWGKVRDGARALCRCNLQFDLGCMHSFPCASLALSGRQWSVSTLVFYGGRSWYFPFPLHSNSIFQGSDLCHSIGLGIRLRLTCWWPMLLSCFLICTLPAVTFLWGEWGVCRKSCHSKDHPWFRWKSVQEIPLFDFGRLWPLGCTIRGIIPRVIYLYDHWKTLRWARKFYFSSDEAAGYGSVATWGSMSCLTVLCCLFQQYIVNPW